MDSATGHEAHDPVVLHWDQICRFSEIVETKGYLPRLRWLGPEDLEWANDDVARPDEQSEHHTASLEIDVSPYPAVVLGDMMEQDTLRTAPMDFTWSTLIQLSLSLNTLQGMSTANPPEFQLKLERFTLQQLSVLQITFTDKCEWYDFYAPRCFAPRDEIVIVELPRASALERMLEYAQDRRDLTLVKTLCRHPMRDQEFGLTISSQLSEEMCEKAKNDIKGALDDDVLIRAFVGVYSDNGNATIGDDDNIQVPDEMLSSECTIDG